MRAKLLGSNEPGRKPRDDDTLFRALPMTPGHTVHCPPNMVPEGRPPTMPSRRSATAPGGCLQGMQRAQLELTNPGRRGCAAAPGAQCRSGGEGVQRPEQQSQPFWHQARLHVREFFHRRGRGWAWFWNYSGAVHLLCILFLLLFHQLHVRSSGVRSQRSETRGLEHLLWFLQEETGVPQTPDWLVWIVQVSLWQRGGPSLLGLAPSWYAQVGGGPARESLMERVVMVRGGHSPVATCLRSPGTS